MYEKGNGLFVMGNGYDRQQRIIEISDMKVCVFRIRNSGNKRWENRWSAEVFPFWPKETYSCYVSRPTIKKAIADAIGGAKRFC